ncbi:hypothetical protein B0A55_08131 [Friedmanniomyces simplex]|uniref:Uncharacterized protein n=1 Tax=Friedmanniomyces simplex TaxID=329884 RepID=A0A4U0XCS6_9PEZI|nr:hypothetical protein B0A55_08131 [Friedmanniomyces simplex]
MEQQKATGTSRDTPRQTHGGNGSQSSAGAKDISMPEGTRRVPQPAQVEDCLSDESSVKPGTARQAKRKTLSLKTPKVVQKRADSDSGYSSHTGTTTHAQTLSKRNPERRYTMSQPYDPVQYAAAMAQYQQQQAQAQQVPQAQQAQPSARQYQYAPQYVQTPISPAVPMATPLPTPRATSTSRPSRPASMYGNVSYSGQSQQHGPPPSPSAYQAQFPAYYQQYQQPAIYGTTPPNQTLPNYPPQSPLAPSPTSMPYAVPPVLTRTYSTREVSTPMVSYGVPKTTAQPPLTRTISARQATNMPGAFPDPESEETESDSASQSETDSEAEREEQRERDRERRDRERRARARDSKLMPPPTRRPSIKERNTTPAVPSRRGPVTPTDQLILLWPQPPPICLYNRIIWSDQGNHEYLTKEQYHELIRRYELQKLEDQEMQDRAEAYQHQVRGRQPPELTAENIRKAERRTSGSHISGHSRKSSNHSSSKNAKNDGIKIQAGDTVLHVYGDARVEMRQGEDGTPAFIIGSTAGSGRDSAYHGSKSSGSRISRRKDTITEEDDGYERAL